MKSNPFGAKALLCAVGAFSVAGCSFFHDFRPVAEPKGGKSCSSALYPVADGLSTLSGVVTLAVASRNEENSRSRDETFPASAMGQPDIIVHYEGNGNTDYRWQRPVGWAMIAVFGASTIYGIVMEARCHARTGESPAATKPTNAPQRTAFPSRIFKFDFGPSLAQAELGCAAMRRTWKVNGARAECTTNTPSAAAQPDVRLEFELGELSNIVVVYRAHPTRLNQWYERLASSFQGLYGSPQVTPAPLSQECARSLDQCLQSGEAVKGPVWHWPVGSIALAPMREDGASVLVLRYARDDPRAR